MSSTSSVPSPIPTDVQNISPYSYVPTKWVCITVITLFGISTLLHFLTAIRYRLWWLIPTACLAGGGEIVGWSGRLWSSINIPAHTPFTMQIVATIIAPTPFLASIFIIFAHMTKLLGTQYSRLGPRLYSAIFVSCDIIALVIQGLGGGVAAGAKTVSGSTTGANIMLAGIVFQLVAMLVFITLAVEYFYRFFNDRPVRGKMSANRDSAATVLDHIRPWNRRLQLMVIGLTISIGFLLIRSIYRTAELGDGWEGKILRTQVYFNVFDGAMVIVAMYALNIFNPGVLLYGDSAGAGRRTDKVVVERGEK